MNDIEKATAIIQQYIDKPPLTAWHFNCQELAELIVAELRPSFTDIIMEKNELGQQCNLGHFHVIYKQSWRGCFPLVLRLFSNSPMTTAGLAKAVQKLGLEATPTIRKAPSELVHFGLLRRTKARGNPLYDITDYGRDVLEGKATCPEWVRPDVLGLTEEQKCGPRKWLHQLKDDHKYTNRQAHVEHSIPSPVSQCLTPSNPYRQCPTKN